MSELKIVNYPSPVLRKKCSRVTNISDELKVLLDQMSETMYKAEGIGLAAPQVGKEIRAFVMDVTPCLSEGEPSTGLLKLINPEITKAEGQAQSEEGCLSIPGIRQKVTRSETIEVKYLNEKGEPKTMEASGISAICIQHELDHLNGVLFIDHLSSLQKKLIKNKLKKLEKAFKK